MLGLSGTSLKMSDETVPRQMPAGRPFSHRVTEPARVSARDAPKAVHVCHCIAIAPRMAVGEISAARTGTVADLGPIPRPRNSRAMKRCHQVPTRADQMQPRPAQRVDQKMAPRRPSQRLSG